MTEEIIQHKCNELPDSIMIFYYDSKKRDKKEWEMYIDIIDFYITKIQYCPFCGDCLND